MPRINLLPWREELRQKRKKDFLTALVGAVIIGGLLAYATKLGVQAQTRSQQGRNGILQDEIALLDQQIEEILGLENQKERLLARMEIIDQLQRARPEVVHLFDEFVVGQFGKDNVVLVVVLGHLSYPPWLKGADYQRYLFGVAHDRAC